MIATEALDLDRALKALACEPRRRIFEFINRADKIADRLCTWDEGEVCVCRIVEHAGLANSTVSHHLNILREAGLIRGRRDGHWIYYKVNEPVVAQLKEAVMAI